MIKQFKMKGMSTSKEEIFGKFGSGGFSSKINYIDHLIDLNKKLINLMESAMVEKAKPDKRRVSSTRFMRVTVSHARRGFHANGVHPAC